MSKSASQSIGTYLLDRLGELGLESETFRIYPAFEHEGYDDELLAALGRSDLIILAFPLYVDSLPSQTIRALEYVAANREKIDPKKDRRLAAICNSGFPESRQNLTALDIVKRFAGETGLDWAGGLPIGGGGAASERKLEEAGGMVKKLMHALDLTAESLAAGGCVPEGALEPLRKSLMPGFITPGMYCLLGGIGWKRQAKRFGVRKRLYDRPYGA